MDLLELDHEFCSEKVKEYSSGNYRYEFEVQNWETPSLQLFFSHSECKKTLTPQEVFIPGFQRSPTRPECGSVRAVVRCSATGKKQIRHNTCRQSGCAVCYPSWTAKAAERTVKRCFALHQINKIHHWSISFDKSIEDYTHMSRLLKQTFPHSFWFFHPFRLQDKDGKSHKDKEADKLSLRWVYGPHFHVLTWESRLNTTAIYEETHAVVHHIQKLDNTFDDFARLLTYEYSHVGLIKKLSGRYQALAGSYGIFSPAKLNKILFADVVKDYHVKCTCPECAEKQNLEDRADTEISQIDSHHIVFDQRYDSLICNRILVISDFTITNPFVQNLNKEKFYFPKIMLKDGHKFHWYLARLGLLRYIKHEDFKRAHQISLDTKKFIGYVEGSGRKALRKPHKSMYPQVFVAEYFQK